MVGNSGPVIARIYGLDGSQLSIETSDGIMRFTHGEPGDAGYWTMAARADASRMELRALTADADWTEFIHAHFATGDLTEPTTA